MADADDWLFTPRQHALYGRLLAELEELRRNKPGSFYVDDMFRTPELARILGAGHPAEAHTALRELFEARRFNNRDVQAAYTSMYWSLGKTVEDRLAEAGRELGLTARNARPYSDRGLQIVARWIVIDLTFANPRAAPQYDVVARTSEDGELAIDVVARGPANGQVGRPYWIEINRKRQNYPDAELLVESDGWVAMRWSLLVKRPSLRSVEPGATASEVAIAFRSIALPKISFADEFDHADFRVRFTARRNVAYVQLLRP